MRIEINEAEGPILAILAERWWAFVLRGLAAVLFGILTWVLPAASLFSLVLLWGAFAVVDGGFALAAAVRSGRAGGRWGWFLLEGLVSIGAGLLTFVWPGITALAGALAVAWMIGGYAVIMGALLIALGVRLRGFSRPHDRPLPKGMAPTTA